jgi:hypothetical protein
LHGQAEIKNYHWEDKIRNVLTGGTYSGDTTQSVSHEEAYRIAKVVIGTLADGKEEFYDKVLKDLVYVP